MKNSKKKIWIAIVLLAEFAGWTALVRLVDVQPIGPNGSSVGFAGLNRYVHEATGVNFALYTITDWLGLVPIGAALGFGVLGLIHWIKRRNIWRVDRNILVLGGFYLVVMAVFLFFEAVVINYRPVLIEGGLEASYPSSTTMLVMCVMPTAIIQCNQRLKARRLKRIISVLAWAFVAFMVIGRFFSGVHWMTDIIGGAILSSGLVMMYLGMTEACSE